MGQNKKTFSLILQVIFYRREFYKLVVFAILMCSLILNFYQYALMKQPANIFLKSSDTIKIHEKIIYQNRIENRLFKNKVKCDLIMNNETAEIAKAYKLLVEYKNEYNIIN